MWWKQFYFCLMSSQATNCSSLEHGESVFRRSWDETGQSVKVELSRSVLRVLICHSGCFSHV